MVPPPTSHTSTSAPSDSPAASFAAVRGNPRVERRDRLLEQDHVFESRLLRRLHGQLAGLFVERRGHGQHNRLLLETDSVSARGLRPIVVPGVAQVGQECAPTLRPATSAGLPRCPRAATAAVRSTEGLASQDLADAICRAGNQRALIASEDAGDDLRRVVPGEARHAGLSAPRRLGSRGTREAWRLARSRRRAASCGTSKMRIGPRRRSTRAPSSSSRDRCRRAACRRGFSRRPGHGCSARASSAGCRRARRTRARSCRPRSSCSRASPGPSRLRWPSTCSVTSSELSSSRSSPQSSIIDAGRIGLADRGAEEPELGRLADRQREFAAGDRRARSFLHPERARRRAP